MCMFSPVNLPLCQFNFQSQPRTLKGPRERFFLPYSTIVYVGQKAPELKCSLPGTSLKIIQRIERLSCKVFLLLLFQNLRCALWCIFFFGGVFNHRWSLTNTFYFKTSKTLTKYVLFSLKHLSHAELNL